MSTIRDPAPERARSSSAGEDAVRPGLIRRLLPILLLFLVGVAIGVSGVHRHLSLEAFAAHRTALADAVAAHRLLTASAMALVYIAVVTLSIPGGLVLTIVCGFLFGPLFGGTLAAVSATIGATLLFILARGSLGAAMREKAGPRLQAFAAGFREDSFHYLLFLRLVPVAPFWLVNLAPAVLGVSTRVFVVATAIGILPATFVFATVGAGLESVIAAQEAANAGCIGEDCRIRLDPRTLATPRLLLALVGLGLLALLPVAMKHWHRLRGGR